MVVIWYAIGIYIVGVAVVLYMRPKSMFQPGGMWKEFGLATHRDYTVFPFWMFALVWAVLSYALATLISLTLASVVLQSSLPSEHSMSTMAPPPSSVSNMSNNFLTPVSAMAPPPTASPTVDTRTPGYYVLDTQPRYVYWGPEPPKWP